ncbi:hypothetical protein, partial [Corynebacterium belfantii]|uniref:hypothetical protein n=1 Tax=Corynebacterium belfantii TaxID=2014537 RepID=UPI001A7E614A
IQQPTGTPTATRLVRQNPHSDTQPHRQKRQYEIQHTKMSQVRESWAEMEKMLTKRFSKF